MMFAKVVLPLACLLLTHTLFSQNEYLVFIKDKMLNDDALVNFSERSLNRRAKNHVAIDSKDYRVNGDYILQLNSHGEIHSSSRWLNAVHYFSPLSAEELKERFSFIDGIQVIHRSPGKTPRKDEVSAVKTIDYGQAVEQTTQLGAQCLHDAGYLGQGVYLAIIDAGFNGMDTVNAFQHVYNDNRLLDTYDFVGAGSVYQYSSHGTMVASTIVALKNDTAVFHGMAPQVDLALYVTEDVSSESQMEEYYLVQGLERADSVGVDVINISLGYFGFDDTTTSYTYQDMNGQTAISSLGARTVAQKGMVLVTSAGNSGPGNIGAPCDADSILCVGAVNASGNYAFFSSVGPSSDNRVKPDVAARGQSAWIITPSGTLTQGNGTSFSSPIMAGAVACALQANTNLSAIELIESIRATGNQFSSPDGFLGYGIPNFCQLTSLTEDTSKKVVIYPNPTKNQLTVELSNQQSFTIQDNLGRKVMQGFLDNENSTIDLSLSNGSYILLLSDGNRFRFTVAN